MIELHEILNSECHDAPAVARRAMEIIRRLEAERDEARRVARTSYWLRQRDPLPMHLPTQTYLHRKYPWLEVDQEQAEEQS